ncbi:Ig-like domain-containing protein [Thalassotalea euphylliae]|uniref:Ig-like protein, group 1 n=1 Tax=Thalassotalea euphylliae TaxID=1655234 RepID=A0A3E0UFM9_9GAMM|nr:Ig-like domain-containing protein [Thalassotalea euphylliae]REL34572.1 Ig-like protein, group 1 [Thalassotalea euphylliae]
MKKYFTALLFASLSLLVGCNGSSGDNPTASESQTVNSITLAILNASGQSQQSFQANDEVQLLATVLDSNGQIIAGRSVSFETTIGSLAVSSRLTNEQGQASVTVTNIELAAGAGTATATIGELTASDDFEFLQATAVQAPSLASQLLVDGQVTSQFKADQQAQIIARLTTNANQPIVNEIVTFTADIGTLNTTTALTNSQGEAKVTLVSDGQIGAGVVVASLGEDSEVTPSQFNYEIIAADAVIVDEGIRIGHIDASGTFNEGEVLLGSDTISAGGTLGLTVDLVDSEGNRINTPTPVSFSSNCVQSGDATVDESVFTIKGSANATFEDLSCAGSSGIDDAIVASITVNGVTSIASSTVSIAGEQLGSIEFTSAEPTSIVLKGTGGQGQQETSTLTFTVRSALGNPLAQQAVDFSLSTQVGGMTLSPTSGLTNSQGIVTVKVTAGTVPTAVRVTAKSTMNVSNETIEVQTQSDLLSVNTGLPEQRSVTLSTDISNPEAGDISGVEAQITARLADNFNNPVPDGTTVNFTTEGGAIEPSCITTNGACSVTWTSAEPRVPDHRITILATALGHETFFDTNGNNTFDDNDGTAIVNSTVSSGRGRQVAQASGFVDMSEAWRDDDEDNQYDAGEVFLDFNNDNSFTTQDGLFNGPQCQGARCAAEDNQAIHVRKAIVMVMASSSASFTLSDGAGDTFRSNITNIRQNVPSISDGSSQRFELFVSDTALQAMPRDTQVTVTSTAGELFGQTEFTFDDRLSAVTLEFLISNPAGGEPQTGVLEVTITAPSGTTTSMSPLTINLN